MRNCPSCQSPLIEAKIGAGTMHICRGCGGKGISSAVLDQAVTPLTYRRIANQYKTTHKASEFHCPLCESAMRSVSLEIARSPHHLDICPSCGLAWFDHFEFEAIPRRTDTIELFTVPEEIQKQLGELEIQNGKRVASRNRFRFSATDFEFIKAKWSKENFKFGRILLGCLRIILTFLMIPVEQGSRLRTTPWFSVMALSCIAIISFYAWITPGVINDLALIGGQGWTETLTRAFTYALVHGNLEHLLGNLYYLWFFGSSVEDEYGGPSYITMLLGGTFIAGLSHLFVEGGVVGLIGVSGGVSALGIIYTLSFPRAKVGFFVGLGWFRFPAYVLTGIWVTLQILIAKDQLQGMTNVSAVAHLAGAMAGLIWYKIYLRNLRVH